MTEDKQTRAKAAYTWLRSILTDGQRDTDEFSWLKHHLTAMAEDVPKPMGIKGFIDPKEAYGTSPYKAILSTTPFPLTGTQAFVDECDRAKPTPQVRSDVPKPVEIDGFKVPDGYVLVPKEPTEKMLKRGYDALHDGKMHYDVYKAMLSAAPPVKADAVDLESLREELAVKLSRLIPHSYSDAVFYNIFDYIAQNYNITRKVQS